MINFITITEWEKKKKQSLWLISVFMPEGDTFGWKT